MKDNICTEINNSNRGGEIATDFDVNCFYQNSNKRFLVLSVLITSPNCKYAFQSVNQWVHFYFLPNIPSETYHT